MIHSWQDGMMTKDLERHSLSCAPNSCSQTGHWFSFTSMSTSDSLPEPDFISSPSALKSSASEAMGPAILVAGRRRADARFTHNKMDQNGPNPLLSTITKNDRFWFRWIGSCVLTCNGIISSVSDSVSIYNFFWSQFQSHTTAISLELTTVDIHHENKHAQMLGGSGPVVFSAAGWQIDPCIQYLKGASPVTSVSLTFKVTVFCTGFLVKLLTTEKYLIWFSWFDWFEF